MQKSALEKLGLMAILSFISLNYSYLKDDSCLL